MVQPELVPLPDYHKLPTDEMKRRAGDMHKKSLAEIATFM